MVYYNEQGELITRRVYSTACSNRYCAREGCEKVEYKKGLCARHHRELTGEKSTAKNYKEYYTYVHKLPVAPSLVVQVCSW